MATRRAQAEPLSQLDTLRAARALRLGDTAARVQVGIPARPVPLSEFVAAHRQELLALAASDLPASRSARMLVDAFGLSTAGGAA